MVSQLSSIMEASLYIPTWNLNSNFPKICSTFSQNSDWYHDLNHGPESGLRETGGPSNSGFISIDCYKVLGSRTLKTDLESPWYLVIMRIVLTYTNAQGEKDVLKNILD